MNYAQFIITVVSDLFMAGVQKARVKAIYNRDNKSSLI